jgi:hypothetical protein
MNKRDSSNNIVAGTTWTANAEKIGSELQKLSSDPERAGMLLGCAAVFARAGGLSREEFEELARQAFDAGEGVTL